jgi:hypothetical protein
LTRTLPGRLKIHCSQSLRSSKLSDSASSQRQLLWTAAVPGGTTTRRSVPGGPANAREFALACEAELAEMRVPLLRRIC